VNKKERRIKMKILMPILLMLALTAPAFANTEDNGG
jgi:hypothetical protein